MSSLFDDAKSLPWQAAGRLDRLVESYLKASPDDRAMLYASNVDVLRAHSLAYFAKRLQEALQAQGVLNTPEGEAILAPILSDLLVKKEVSEGADATSVRGGGRPQGRRA